MRPVACHAKASMPTRKRRRAGSSARDCRCGTPNKQRRRKPPRACPLNKFWYAPRGSAQSAPEPAGTARPPHSPRAPQSVPALVASQLRCRPAVGHPIHCNCSCPVANALIADASLQQVASHCSAIKCWMLVAPKLLLRLRFATRLAAKSPPFPGLLPAFCTS